MVGLKSALRRKLEMSVPSSDLRFYEDPYLRLGFGMHSYLQIQVRLMCLMGLILTLSVPLMLFYASFDGLEHLKSLYSFNQFSMGNLGGNSALCHI